ncbi:MAG: hypothetical protein ACTSSF_08650 [Candidatus Heimdallarchaeaceae archaeon]
MNYATFVDYLKVEDILEVLPNINKKRQTIEQLRKKLLSEIKKSTISSQKLKKTWSAGLRNFIFQSFQQSYLFTPTKKFETSQKLKIEINKKEKVILEKLKIEQHKGYLTKINSKPAHYLYVTSSEKVKDFSDFCRLKLEKLEIHSFFPEIGLAMFCMNPHKDRNRFSQELIKNIFSSIESIKVNALLLRKFSTQEVINKLVISTPQEIAGFPGLDCIEFKGPNVVLGLSGLKRRHDANVDVITRVGPFSEVESDAIRLVCGKGILFKNYEGITSLLKILKS